MAAEEPELEDGFRKTVKKIHNPKRLYYKCVHDY